MGSGKRGACALVVAALVCATGCAGVKPYDRGMLARPKMQLEPMPDGTALEEHVYEYREGASGGYGGGGGGCGCN
jgi:hypothetical protein